MSWMLPHLFLRQKGPGLSRILHCLSTFQQPQLWRTTDEVRCFSSSLPHITSYVSSIPECPITPIVAHGNITCENAVSYESFGETFYEVSHGDRCELYCKSGYVSQYQKVAYCSNGRLAPRLECVRPDALLLLAGRNGNGVLNTAELVTGRGVCRGAVPPLPAMRWRMIAESIGNYSLTQDVPSQLICFADKKRILACGGVNIFGDPKRNCWTLGFDPEPFWSEARPMLVARDAAAWALEGNFLIVLGGSLGKLNG